METDNQLLAEYARHGSEHAFRELVQRHINMVHGSALREAGGNAALAEDIAQEVFTALARRAGALVSHPAPAGWLYAHVRLTAANLRRADYRRRRREQEAYTMNEPPSTNETETLWRQVRPVLDDAMHELGEEARAAVVLRFFEGRNHRQIGALLGLSENAARMRVERSLEKLHGLLARRGITSTASALAAALVAGAVLSAPPALAASIATGALAAGGRPAAFSLAEFLAPAKVQVAALGTLAVIGALLLAWHSQRPVRAAATALDTPGPAPAAAAATNAAVLNAPGRPAAFPAAAAPAAPQMLLQLLDSRTGAPLPDAKLHLYYLLADGRGKRVKAVTDSQGQAAVALTQAPYRALNMFVTAPGHVPKVISWGLRQPMPAAYMMKLDPGATIGGVVLDPAGQPVNGANIEFDSGGNDPSLAENIQFGPDTPVKTGPDGRWSCDMIPREREDILLHVSQPDYAETNLTVRWDSPDARHLAIILPAACAVAGVVADTNGNPIASALVRQVRLNDEREHTATTDAGGVFRLKGFAAGELMLVAQASAFAPAVQTLQVTDSLAGVRFVLEPGRLLRGRIADESGHPIAGAFIETTRRGVNKIRWSTNADPAGRFQWDSAPAEPQLYSVLAQGYDRAPRTLIADGTEQVIKLTAVEPGQDSIRVTGTAVDADTGVPLDSFKVLVGEVETDWAFPLEYYTTGHDGKFALTLSTKSNHPAYQVQIEEEGYLPAASAECQRTNGDQTLEFKLYPGAGPSGTVLLPDGSPAAGAAVLLCTPLAGVTLADAGQIQRGINTSTYRAETDRAGKFALAAALNPQGLIIVHDQGYAEVALADLPAGGTVALQAWGSVRGRLVLDSQPVAQAGVTIWGQTARYTETGRRFGFLTFRGETTTDAEGNFHFGKVPPGRWEVYQELKMPPGLVQSHNVEAAVRAGAETEVTLGGAGRAVVGKAAVPAGAGAVNWRRVAVELVAKTGNAGAARPRREDFSTLQEYESASENFFQGYQTAQSIAAVCESDGSFRLPDVTPGAYELKIQVRDAKLDSAAPHDISDPSPVVASLDREISVAGDGAEPLDLGVLELSASQGL